MDIKRPFSDVIREYLADRPVARSFEPSKTEIPVSGGKDIISNDDVLMLMDCVLGKWYTEGKYAERFIRQLHVLTGASFVTLCNSGSSANLLALTAVKDFFCKPNDKKKVLTCATGFPTTVAPIIQNGLIPVFIDIDETTLNVDVDSVIEAFESDPDIIGCIFAHTLGFPFDAPKLAAYLQDKAKFLIEDSCDSLGAMINNKHVGSFGQAGTYSFFPAHHITSAEGGAVTTNYKTIYDSVGSYCNWGRGCRCAPGQSNVCGKRFEQDAGRLPHGYDHKYIFDKVGYNLKMTDLQAALGYSQSLRAKEVVASRMENYWYMRNSLTSDSDVMGSILGFPFIPEGFTPSPFGFPMVIKPDLSTARELAAWLENRKIRTRPIFAGNIVRHPMMSNVDYRVVDDLSASDEVMRQGLWIGCHPGLTKEMMDYMVESIIEFVESR